MGTKPTTGAAFELNEQSWLWLLPMLCALTWWLPRPRDEGKLPVQRRWYPISLLLLWILGTGVHLYSLAYVYDFDLRRELLAPTLWALAWTIHLRLKDFVAKPAPALRVAALSLPLLATLPAVGVSGSRVGFTLMALNVMGFACVALFDLEHRAARHLLMIALAMLAGLWCAPHPCAVHWALQAGLVFYLLFGLGTLAALTKHRWHREGQV